MKTEEIQNEIYHLYDEYIKKVTELEKNRKITDGLFGITKGPKDDPCHDRFADQLKQEIDSFICADPDSAQVRSVLEYMYRMPLEHRDQNMIYWMFCAVHSLAVPLTDLLSKEDAEQIYKQYNSDYPRRDRLPAQKNTLKALKSRAYN